MAALLLAGAPLAGLAQPAKPAAADAEPAKPAETAKKLPADSVTHHTLALTGRKLEITATAGAVTLSNAEGVAQAQIGFVAYTRADLPAEKRPITFALNGGPGSASAWLQLGVLGPWRVKMDGDAAIPSADPVPVANDDTWLDFTDLVFIDPVGTGFSKLLVNTEENRKKYFSVKGDVPSIAEAIRLYLVQSRRMTSPKFIVGESYGGFRGPRLVRELASEQGVGITGLVLISPALDFGGRGGALNTLGWIAQLPSLAAAVRARKGAVSRADLADVEAYAIGDYATDLLRGEDPAALARRKEHIAALTGLDARLIELRHGEVSDRDFRREGYREQNAIASAYDSTITKPDPFPERGYTEAPDAMTDALAAPFTSAIYDIYARKLNWVPDGQYELSNGTVFKAWDLGTGFGRPESMSALRQDLAADPHLRVLIGHGLFDLVTPYFATKLMLDQIPASVGRARVDLQVYPGGHMFYARDASRAAFRAAAETLYAPE
jgi:carboxypeptidase C (cathepsin A)